MTIAAIDDEESLSGYSMTINGAANDLRSPIRQNSAEKESYSDTEKNSRMSEHLKKRKPGIHHHHHHHAHPNTFYEQKQPQKKTKKN